MDNLKLRGQITLIAKKDGKIVEMRKMHNLIVNTGIASIIGRIGAATIDPFLYLAVGTGTTSEVAGDTALETEITDTGLARAEATLSIETTTVTDDTHVLTYAWTATGDKAVTEVGMLNAASAGVLLGRKTFAAINMVDDMELQAIYKVIGSVS
jgi:hypothetical protein